MGYYHETPTGHTLFDPRTSTDLLDMLQLLARCGTAVVCSAGNDATARPLYPAAFAPWQRRGHVADRGAALVADRVGGRARTPNDSVALFSNTGPWVRRYEHGRGAAEHDAAVPGRAAARLRVTRVRPGTSGRRSTRTTSEQWVRALERDVVCGAAWSRDGRCVAAGRRNSGRSGRGHRDGRRPGTRRSGAPRSARRNNRRVLSAVELHQRGLAASNAARYARARGLFQKALERSQSGRAVCPGVAQPRARRLRAERSRGGSSRVATTHSRSRGSARRLVGLIQSQRGLLLGRSGLADAALDAFAHAQNLLDDDDEALMRLHLNRGNVYLMRGDAGRASRDFERAVQHAEQAGLDVQTAKARYNLGYARLLTGDLVSALQMMDLAKPTLAALSVTSAAVCEQDRAEVLAASGMVTDAADGASRRRRLPSGVAGLRHQQAEAEFVLARLLVLEDPVDALRVARRADRRFGRRGSEGWALRSRAVAVAAEIEAGGASTALLERADALIAELERHRLRNEAAGVRLRSARPRPALGELASATRRVEAAHVTGSQPLGIRLLARETRADLARRRGRRGTPFGICAADWQSCMTGSRRSGASICRARSSGTGVASRSRGCRTGGRRRASRASFSSGPSAPARWRAGCRRFGRRRTDAAADELADLRQLQIEIKAAEARGVVPKSMLGRAQRCRDDPAARVVRRGLGHRRPSRPARTRPSVVRPARRGAVCRTSWSRGRLYALVVTGDDPDARRARPVRARSARSWTDCRPTWTWRRRGCRPRSRSRFARRSTSGSPDWPTSWSNRFETVSASVGS